MSERVADVAVVGLGAAGSATLHQLALRGVDATGFDRFAPPHARGSSHGETRITRLAIGEGVAYTPLVRRSHDIWRALERETGEELLVGNGCLVLQDDAPTLVHSSVDFLGTTLRSAAMHGVPCERLTAADVTARFPQFAPDDTTQACFEPAGGFVRPEAVIRAQLAAATRHGARVLLDMRVRSVAPDHDGVRIITDDGEWRANRCVISAGAWTSQLVPALQPHVEVRPQTVAWYAVTGSVDHSPRTMPSFIWATAGDNVLYGIPGDDGATVKIGTEQHSWSSHPDDPAILTVDASDVARLHAELIATRLPHVSSRCVAAIRCLYTTTRDSGFIVDRDPRSDRIVVVSACSGHGFKHSAGLGEAVATIVTGSDAGVDLTPFALSRFE